MDIIINHQLNAYLWGAPARLLVRDDEEEEEEEVVVVVLVEEYNASI